MFYLYLIFIICLFSYNFYKDLVRYKEGRYNPNRFLLRGKDDSPFWKGLPLNFIIAFGVAFIFHGDNHKNKIIFIITFIIILMILMIEGLVLNYLTYRKSKDKKIISHSFVLIIVTIIFILIFWRLLAAINSDMMIMNKSIQYWVEIIL